jgi:hypothetical protein
MCRHNVSAFQADQSRAPRARFLAGCSRCPLLIPTRPSPRPRLTVAAVALRVNWLGTALWQLLRSLQRFQAGTPWLPHLELAVSHPVAVMLAGTHRDPNRIRAIKLEAGQGRARRSQSPRQSAILALSTLLATDTGQLPDISTLMLSSATFR